MIFVSVILFQRDLNNVKNVDIQCSSFLCVHSYLPVSFSFCLEDFNTCAADNAFFQLLCVWKSLCCCSYHFWCGIFCHPYISLYICFCSVPQSCLTLCDPMNCSTLGFPVLHRHPEFAQTHVHWVGDAIQPSHPLSPLLLCICDLFLWLFLRFIYFSLVLSDFIMMCLGIVTSSALPSVSCAWDLLGFLDLWVYSFHEIWNFSAIISSFFFWFLLPMLRSGNSVRAINWNNHKAHLFASFFSKLLSFIVWCSVS